MFASRLSIYFSSIVHFYTNTIHTLPMVLPVLPVASPVRSIGSTPPKPEWPCLEDCQTLNEQIQRIQTLFLDRGGDINQKHPTTKKSALYEVLTFHHEPKEVQELTKLFFEHGAKIDPSEYNDESPFSHIFYFSKLEKEALFKIKQLIQLGVSPHIKNVRGETLLETAKRIQLSKSGIFQLQLMVQKSLAHK